MAPVPRFRRRLAALCVAVAAAVALPAGALPRAHASVTTGSVITVNDTATTGVVQPTATGQMMEWASDEQNGAWAERVQDRSMETDTVGSHRSTLYDGFTGSTLDTSRWTPLSLDGAPAGTVTVSNGSVAVAGAAPGRFGIMSKDIPNTRYAKVGVETKVQSYTGANAIMDLYGGTGAGDFSHFVEFAIEGGVLKVFADGQPAWVGGAATTPAVLRIDVSPLSDTSRTLTFSYNGTVVHTLSGFTLLPENFRTFLYGWSGTATFDYLTVNPDSTYDSFAGSSLSPRWTPTAVAGSSGTVAVGGGQLTVNGAANSRYGVLSNPITNSDTDWTTVSAQLNSVSGTNGLMDIYGGAGAGDFSHFMEFGVEGGVAKVFTSDGTGNWVGSAVTLPATLSVQVSPWWSNGRLFRFSINGSEVYELDTRLDVPASPFRVFLYGFGTTTTQWTNVGVDQVHFWDRWDTGFEGNGGLAGSWTPTTLAGGWGSVTQSNSEAVITGAANSRYGIISGAIDQSDLYGYTLQAKLDSYSGTNGLMDVYAGSGRGDFSQFLEFGIEAGTLRVYGAGVPSWTGPAMATPAVLRIEVGPWTPSGRNVFFYANGQLEYELLNNTVIGDKNYQGFLYGWGTSVTKWDYFTWWKSDQPWNADGYADRADYTQDQTSAANGTRSERIDITQHTTGRAGVSQDSINLVGGHQYQVSAYLKQSSLTAPVSVSLGPAGGDGPSYSAYASTTFSGVSGTWTKYTATLTPTTTDQQAKLFIGTAGTGTLWIDQVSVMPLDPSEVVYGGWRKDFVDKLRALNPGAIRWPGGIISDSYNWQDGVGSRDSRPPQYYGQWDAEVMSNDVGTDEILNLGQQLGIPILLNVNWGTGTPAEAANWVQYVNGASSTTYGAQRAANGRTAPWGVHEWEVGNEVWGGWTAGHTDATTFANSYITFHDAMAAQDPTIDFVAEGGDGTQNSQAWNNTVLSIAGSKLNNLSIHYYSPQGLPQAYDSTALYQASVGAPVAISGRLDDTLNTVLATTNRDVKVAVTEHNAMYFNEENHRTRTLEGGLQEAGLLNLFLRRPEINSIDTASALANFWDGSAIRLSNRGSFVTPGYLAQQLIGNNHGPLVVATNVSTGTYGVAAIGNLPAQSAIPYLDVTSTRSADGTKLYLSVVNRDGVNDQAATINLANAGTISGTATAQTLDSGSYLDQNSWLNPTLIQTATSTVTGVGSSFAYTFPAHSLTVLTVGTGAPASASPVLIGQVTDSTGAPIAGATVTTSSNATGTTDSAGYYRIPAPAGTYSVTVTAGGYAPFTRTAIAASSVGATPLPIRLTQAGRVAVFSAAAESLGQTVAQTFDNQSLRMVAHTTVAGSQPRVRLSNVYGAVPLTVGAVDLAQQTSAGTGTAVAGTHHAVTFKGSGSVTILPGQDVYSDPVAMSVGADQDLLVSLYLPNSPSGADTWHEISSDTTWVSTAGNHVSDDGTGNYPTTTNHWYVLAGLDAVSTTATGTVVCVGDSITDGFDSTTGSNHRWPDDLARELVAAPGGPTRGVVDAGISANRILTDTGSGSNPALISRFQHDVISQANVKEIVMLEGINDIGNNIGSNGAGPLTATDLENGMLNAIGRAHAAGLKIIGATILPFQGAGYYSTYGEQVREAVNSWIRTSGAFDGFVDLDQAMQNPSNTLALNPAYDSGDHLHPNDAGYQHMADTVHASVTFS